MVGLGIDVCAVARIAALLERWGDRFRDRILTERECALVASRTELAAALAARYAAKEAFAKVTGGGRGVGWHHVEILGGGRRPPEVVLHGPAEALVRALGASRVLVSLSHDAGIAVAVMILEGPGPAPP
ncbi:MAG: holo-ACP synthase [Myxococcales bacterium]|nr:holo-ACP synthase [Myxococcales bacterium]